MRFRPPSTVRQLRRMLRGDCCAFYTGIVCILVSFLFLPAMLGSDTDAGEVIKASVVSFVIGSVITAVFSFQPLRAHSTLRRLGRFGETEDALADLNQPDIFLASVTGSSHCNVLGKKFIFIFSTGRIIHYYQIAALRLCLIENRRQLNITDRYGKTYSLAETTGSTAPISACIRELHRRYPGCPPLSRSDEEAVNI